MPRVRVELLASDATLDRVDRLARFFENMGHGPDAKTKKRIADEIRWGFAENFANEQTGAGVPWAPLAPRTQAERRALGYMAEHPILERTGRYLYSWTREDGPDHISEFKADGLGWEWEEGSADPRVGDLEIGNPATNLEGRPVRFLSAKSEQRIANVLSAYFTQAVPKR